MSFSQMSIALNVPGTARWPDGLHFWLPGLRAAGVKRATPPATLLC
jgi:hypothetical protein